MIRLISGDWQLESRPPCDRKDEYGKSVRFQENIDEIMEMISAAHKKGARGMDHLGDLSEEINPDSAVMVAAAACFRHALDLGYTDIAGVAGNHDGSLFYVSSSSMAPFTVMEKDIHFYHAATWHKNGLYLPYLHEKSPADLGAILAKQPETKDAVLLAHYAYTGCTIGAKNLVLPGDYLGRGQVPAMFKLAFFGHIHKQQVVKDGDLTVVFPGSPVICDHGEREDPKGYALWDTETNKYELFQIKPRRRWVDIPWHGLDCAQSPEAPQPWLPTDIVRLTGIREDNTNVKSELVSAFKAGNLQEPFYYRDATTLKAQERVVRSEDVAEAADLRDAVMAYFGKQYPEADNVPASTQDARCKALAMILDALKTAKPTAYSSVVVPESIEGTNWMSWPTFKYTFRQGTPVLVVAENGVGKTNFLEAILFCMTGMTSKKLKNATLVRQGAKETNLAMRLHGDRADFQINRTIKLSKAGAPVQKVKLIMRKHGSETWESLADGGISDTQAILQQVIGASYASLRATRFAFQKDLSPFLGAEPAERKQVLAEIIGLAPLAVVYKDFNDHKNAVVKLHGEATASLAGMLEIFRAEEVDAVEALLSQAVATLEGAESEAKKAENSLSQVAGRVQISRSHVEEVENALARIPNSGAEVAALEQALASEGQAHEAALVSLAVRFGTADQKAKAFLAKKPQEALEAAQARTRGLLEAVESAPVAREQAEKEASAAVQTLATVRAQVSAKTLEIATQESTYTNTRKGLVERYTAAKTKLADMVSSGKGKPGLLESAEARIPELTTASEQAIENTKAAEERKTDATTTFVTADTELKSTRARIAELSTAETGNCTKCGAPLNTAHLEKELADLKPVEVAQSAEYSKAVAAKFAVQLHLDVCKSASASAAKALADQQALVVSLRRDITDLADRQTDFDKVKAEGEKLTSEYTTAKAALELDLVALTKQCQVAEAEALPLQKAVEAAQAAEASARTAYNAHLLAVLGIEQDIKGLNEAESEKNGIIIENATQVRTHEERVTKLTSDLASKRKETETWDTHRKSLETSLKGSREVLETITREEAEAKAFLGSQQRLLAVATESKRVHAERLADLRATQAKIESVRTREQELREKLEVLTFAADALNPRTGLPVFLIDAKLAFLENRINAHLARLGSSRLTVSLTTLDGDKETLAVMIDNGKPPMLEINAYSGGQWDRIEASVKKALTELAEQTLDVRLGFLGWDEPGIYLDATGKSNLVALAHEAAVNGEAPVGIIISNDRQIISSFSAKVHVVEDEEGGAKFSD